jgi:hypothetical protein
MPHTTRSPQATFDDLLSDGSYKHTEPHIAPQDDLPATLVESDRIPIATHSLQEATILPAYTMIGNMHLKTRRSGYNEVA